MKTNTTIRPENQSQSPEEVMADHAAAGNDPDDFSRFIVTDQGVPDVVTSQPLAYVRGDKPPSDSFIRTHPDTENRWVPVNMLHKKSGSLAGLYLVLPQVAAALKAGQLGKGKETSLKDYLLVQYTDWEGENQIWPIANYDLDKDHAKTRMAAARDAVDKWLRVIWDHDHKHYVTQTAEIGDKEPIWRDEPFMKLVQLAFHDRVIEDMQHPVVVALRGGAGV